MEENSIMLLKKNIIKIEKINKENKNIIKFWEGVELELFSINKITHKYSNIKVPLYRFFLIIIIFLILLTTKKILLRAIITIMLVINV